jgi:hypothetical protein
LIENDVRSADTKSASLTFLIYRMRLGRRSGIAVCIWLMTACNGVYGPSAAAPSPSPSPADVASPTPPATPSPTLYQVPPTASPTSSPFPVPPGSSCLVPFADISEANGGFITYPGGQRLDDPSSVVALPGNTPGQIGVNPGLAYDRVLHTWVPVPPDWLAPEGQTYAYQVSSGNIRAVTVADGTSGDVTTDGGWELLTTADDGVYAGKLNTPGAWFIPFGGVPRQIVDHGTWVRFANGGLWGIDSSRNVIQHVLPGDVEVNWGQVSSTSAIVGLATNEPLVATGGALVISHMSGPPTTVWPGTGDLGESGRAYTDAFGTWFEVEGSRIGEPGTGIYLWSAAKGAQLIAPEPVHVLGLCA